MGEFSINGTQNWDVILQAEKNLFKPTFPLSDSKVSMIISDHCECFFQEVKLKRCSIWVSEYWISQDVNLYGAVNEPVLELHCMLDGGMSYQMDGLGNVKMPSYSFNLYQQPYVENRVKLMKGAHVITFDIHFEQNYLEELCGYYVQLNPFLEEAIKARFCLLSKVALPLNKELSSIIHSVLQAPSRPAFQSLCLGAAIDAYVLEAIFYLTGEHKLPLKSSQHERGAIEDIKHFLRTKPDEYEGILALAKQFAINTSQMKKLFKESTGMTIFQYLTKERMFQASLLLKEGETVEKTAFMSGYQNTSAFIHKFKQLYLLSPLQYQKNK